MIGSFFQKYNPWPLSSLLWVCGEAEHHGGDGVARQKDYIKIGGKQ